MDDPFIYFSITKITNKVFWAPLHSQNINNLKISQNTNIRKKTNTNLENIQIFSFNKNKNQGMKYANFNMILELDAQLPSSFNFSILWKEQTLNIKITYKKPTWKAF